jgi:H+-transporting ATPase
MLKERSTEQPPRRPGPAGLTSDEARVRLQQYGLNAVPEGTAHPWRIFLARFWAPIPWMLEFAIVLEVLLGRALEALVFAVLLVFNALLSAFQENRAQRALALLRKRLTVQARAFRDGRWTLIHAEELVPGDVVRLRAGDLVAADLKMFDGQFLVDHPRSPVSPYPWKSSPAGLFMQARS